jgi:hypothetical protein
MAALNAVAQAVLMALGLYQAGQSLGALGGPAGGQIFGTGLSNGDSGGFFGGLGARVKRHRRRKALTNDDVRLALTIASSISKKAAETFIAQRVRMG